MKNCKFTTSGKVLTIAAALTLALAITPTASAQYQGCSNGNLRGTFSQAGSGVITSPPDQAGPFANVGTLFFDGNGGITGSLTISQNGVSAQATETGTYKVNSDCTG